MEALQRVADKIAGNDPLSRYQSDATEIADLEGQLASINATVESVDRELRLLLQGESSSSLDRQRLGAKLTALEDRRGDLQRRLRELTADRPRLAEAAFLDSSPARKLRGELERTAEALALLLGREAALRKEFAAKHQIALSDRRALTVPGVDPAVLVSWHERRSADNA